MTPAPAVTGGTPGRRRTLIVSDLHLCDVEDHADGWKRYKSSEMLYDQELVALLERFQAEAEPGEPCLLVLNGDIIDFDLVTRVPDPAPFPVSRGERRRGLDPLEQKAVWTAELVLAQHPSLADGIARFLVAGHRVLYVMGNHDREFHFEGVQRALVGGLQAAAARQGLSFPHTAVTFEPWFYHEPGWVFIEYGNQYDPFSSFPNLLSPTIVQNGEQSIDLPMGNLTNRTLISVMGYFNPHSTNFILNAWRYVAHWLRYYAFTRRSLVINWLWGSVLVMAQLFGKLPASRRRRRDHLEAVDQFAERAGVPVEVARRIDAMKRPPIVDRVFGLLRELWLDRVLLALLMTIGTVALAVSGAPLWVKLMVPLSSLPLLWLVYESLARSDSILGVSEELRAAARRIAGMLPVRVVAFGHTHAPEVVPLGRGVSYVNTGTWAPVFQEIRGPLEPGLRNYVILRFEGDAVHIELGACMPVEPG